MSCDALILVKSISLSRTKGHKPCTLRDAVRHNRRLIQAEMGAVARIDPRKSHQNIIMAGEPSCDGVLDEARRLLDDAGIATSGLRYDWVQAVEFLFSLDPECPGIDKDRFWRRCIEWLHGTCKLHVLSADLHRDEPIEHLHCLVSPVQQGRFEGGKLINVGALRKLRQSFWSNVAGPAGLKHPNPKLRGYAKVAAAALVIEHLTRLEDLAPQSAVWRLIEKDIRRDPRQYMEMLDLRPDQVRERLLSMSGHDGSKREVPIECSAGHAWPVVDMNPTHCRDRNSQAARLQAMQPSATVTDRARAGGTR